MSADIFTKTKEDKMKKLFTATLRCNAQALATKQLLHHFTWNSRLFIYWIVSLWAFLFTGCTKDAVNDTGSQAQLASTEEMSANAANEINANAHLRTWYKGLDEKTLCELEQARAASAKYRDFNKAIADGYADINVVVQNMGYHFMRSKQVDATFEISKPELLVYNKLKDGSFQLVAVEYAVPITEPRPKGFAGSADVWQHNTDFNLWLLHAWVWKYNPDGVFNPTNPTVNVIGSEVRASCAPERK
jgi:hypothetical protein